MDRSVYVAMTGAVQVMQAQDEVANNIANANTTGFKAAVSAFQGSPVLGEGKPTRVNVVSRGEGYDMDQGALEHTGRALDVAVEGPGWIAVESPQGGEGYTRAGNLQLTSSGLLTDDRGDPVLGNDGPITLPPVTKIQIGSDGTISIVPSGEMPNATSIVDRIMLVNPPSTELQLGGDGLMHLPNGVQAAPAADVKLVSGALEQSNVNAATALVEMVSLARQFDLQIDAIHSADQNAQAASQLLAPTS